MVHIQLRVIFQNVDLLVSPVSHLLLFTALKLSYCSEIQTSEH